MLLHQATQLTNIKMIKIQVVMTMMERIEAKMTMISSVVANLTIEIKNLMYDCIYVASA